MQLTTGNHIFDEVYGKDLYHITVPVDGSPVIIECNGEIVKWRHIPVAIRIWLFRAFEGKGQGMEAWPFPHPPTLQESITHGKN
jgi:hypothetical protein